MQIPAVPDAAVSIYTVRSNGWAERVPAEEKSKRREWVAHIMRDWAATKLQRAWRAARASPYTAVGKKRLLGEYEELQAMHE